ncbi:MAG: type II secretion system protein [Bacillota bacterium]|nr:type II secretion system protein [Bacillota bacterium]
MRNKKRESGNKGFTLVEMLVSFVILMILASLSVAGVLAYQDYADYKRQNSYAQTLFLAAQTKLTSYSVRGQMDGLAEAASDTVELGTILTPDGSSAAESKKGAAVKSGNVCYLLGNRESYQKYCAGEYQGKTDKESMGYQALYDIFDEFLFDKSVLNACIAIEFNPECAQVYSVLYSDKCSEFTYFAKNRNGRVNIQNRQEDYRSEYMIGYYGLD